MTHRRNIEPSAVTGRFQRETAATANLLCELEQRVVLLNHCSVQFGANTSLAVLLVCTFPSHSIMVPNKKCQSLGGSIKSVLGWLFIEIKNTKQEYKDQHFKTTFLPSSVKYCLDLRIFSKILQMVENGLED